MQTIKQTKSDVWRRGFCRFILLISALTIWLLSFTGCRDVKDKNNPIGIVDYSNPYNWVSLPVPDTTKSVDVFYVYPTVSDDASGSMDITNDAQRALAAGIRKAQASVFDSCVNVFAPYYRQMTTAVEQDSGDATDNEYFKIGSADVDSAFCYYISRLNDNRPFILAGHSQGTMALIELIKKHRVGKDSSLSNRLVAAYLIGYTVTDSDLDRSGLAVAKGADDVGVIITYNTQSDSSEGGPMLLSGAHCINPLTWKTNSVYADSTKNLGAVFFDDETGKFIIQVKKYCSARIARIDTETAALIAHIPENDSLDIGPYTEGVYHRYDYAFWYRNLQKNVEDRINAFLNKSKPGN